MSDELAQRALYLVEHRHELAGSDWFVPEVKWTAHQLIPLVAQGAKPFAELLVTSTKTISGEEYHECLRTIMAKVKSTPKTLGLDYWVQPRLSGFPVVHFGLPGHRDAWLKASQWKAEGRWLEADALFGLAFGYPEDRIARFLFRALEFAQKT